MEATNSMTRVVMSARGERARGAACHSLRRARAPAKPLSEIIGPLKLDRLTVADDPQWLETIDNERNLPDWLAPGLRKLY